MGPSPPKVRGVSLPSLTPGTEWTDELSCSCERYVLQPQDAPLGRESSYFATLIPPSLPLPDPRSSPTFPVKGIDVDAYMLHSNKQRKKKQVEVEQLKDMRRHFDQMAHKRGMSAQTIPARAPDGTSTSTEPWFCL